MKKLLILFSVFCLLTNGFASSGSSTPSKNANDIFLTINKDVQLSLLDLSVIRLKDFEKITGKHLNIFKKIAFKAAQKKLRNSINEDGTVNNKRLLKYMGDTDHSKGFHAGGFFLGLFLGPIGVLLAYLLKGDKGVQKNRAKWAWVGFGIFVILFIIWLSSGPFAVI